MRKKKTKKMGDDAAASDEAGRKAVGRGPDELRCALGYLL